MRRRRPKATHRQVPCGAIPMRRQAFGTARRWWVLRESNPRHSPCKGDALPAELSTLVYWRKSPRRFPQDPTRLPRTWGGPACAAPCKPSKAFSARPYTITAHLGRPCVRCAEQTLKGVLRKTLHDCRTLGAALRALQVEKTMARRAPPVNAPERPACGHRCAGPAAPPERPSRPAQSQANRESAAPAAGSAPVRAPHRST